MIRKLRQIILFAGDIFACYLSLVLTLLIGFKPELTWEVFVLHLLPFSILYLSWLIVLYIFDLYNLNISRDKFLFYPRFIQSLIVSIILGIAFFYLWPAFGITPKTNLALNIFFFGGLIIIWRKIFYSLFSKKLTINVAILGDNKEASVLAREIIGRPYLGYKLRKIYSINNNKSLIANIKTSKIKKNFADELKKDNIETLIITKSDKTNDKISSMLYDCMALRVNFWELSHAYEIICKKIPVDFIDKAWFLENLREGEKSFQDKIKKIIDFFFACLFLIITLPLWALIALLIKLGDAGPVFYKQKRVGKDSKEFWLFKFRSMKQNAENGKAIWAEKNDPRITSVGKILRASHLDELPQMINVIKGDLSLVGPRPERNEFVKKLEKQIPYYNLRSLIKPGVTGWDQIKFKYARTIEDSSEKLEYDLYYLKNRNLFLDFGIILKTFQSFFKKG